MKKKQTTKILCKDMILTFYLGFEMRVEAN
jgi:hypothetical protein